MCCNVIRCRCRILYYIVYGCMCTVQSIYNRRCLCASTDVYIESEGILLRAKHSKFVSSYENVSNRAHAEFKLRLPIVIGDRLTALLTKNTNAAYSTSFYFDTIHRYSLCRFSSARMKRGVDKYHNECAREKV